MMVASNKSVRFLLAGVLAVASVGCDSDSSQEAGDTAEVFSPELTGSAHFPYTESSSLALLDAETACGVDSYYVKVQCMSRAGEVVARFGQEGEGPGEFRRPTGLVRGVDGTLGVVAPSRGRFLVFTRNGAMVTETVLPVLVFDPIQPFGSTVAGTYVSSAIPGTDAALNFAATVRAAEISLETGEVVEEWQPPGGVPVVEECDALAFGFPVVGERERNAWVFLGCEGYLVFADNSSELTMTRAPGHVDETPSERDVDYMEEVFGGLARSSRASGNETDFSDIVADYANETKPYYLLRGQEIFDAEGRLWISTSRDRDQFSYLDVYSEAQYVGTVKVRERMLGFDVNGSTLAVLVERRVGPDDPDGVADIGIDWYDLNGFR